MRWKLIRALQHFARHGPRAGLAHLARSLRRQLLRLTPSQRRWIRRHKLADRAFDRRNALDTQGFVRLSSLGPGHEHLPGDYIPISEGEFRSALDSLRIEHARFSFVDFGSGKGKAVLLAASYPFREIQGVEFAQELHRIAQRNLLQYKSAQQRCHNIALFCGDAAQFAIPAGPVVLFLYNPFGPDIVRAVAARAAAAHREQPREMWVVYVNPPHSDLWEQAGFERVVAGDGFDLLRPHPA